MNDTTTQTPAPSGGFEQRLLQELLAEVRDNPSRLTLSAVPKARRRRRIVTAGIVAAAAVTTSVATPILLGGHASAKAYAVTKQTDGSVTVTIYRFDDAAGLRKQLAEVGVQAVVAYTSAGKMCQQPQFTRADVPLGIVGRASSGPGGVMLSFTLTPAQVGAHTLVIEYSGALGAPREPSSWSTVVGLADGPVGPCVLVDIPAANLPSGPTAVSTQLPN